MKRLNKIYEEAIRQLEEDAIATATPPAAGDPIDVKTDKVEGDDPTANSDGVGVKDVLGDFDPNKGIGTPQDNYIPTKKRKKKNTEDLAPLPKKVEVDDNQGELLNASNKKGNK